MALNRLWANWKLAQQKALGKRMDGAFVNRHIIYRFFRRENFSPVRSFLIEEIFLPTSSEKIRIRDDQFVIRQENL